MDNDDSNTRVRAVWDALSEHGINVPDDCIVTGFDYNEEGRIQKQKGLLIKQESLFLMPTE